MRTETTGRAGVTAGVLGISDQVLLSATNLLIGLLLARELEPSAFGLYVIGFAVFLMGTSVQISLVTDPLVIFGPARTGADQSAYFGALLRIQVILSLAVALAAAATAGGAALVSPGARELARVLVSVPAAILPCQIQCLARAILFARFRPDRVLLNDSIFAGLRLAMIGALFLAGSLTPSTAFLATGVAGGVAGLAALPWCRDLLAVSAGGRATWNQHWRFGRWLLATAAAYWCSGQAPALLVSMLLSPAAAAVIRACQYLIAPVNVALSGLDGVLSPRASRVAAVEGERSAVRFLRRFGIMATMGVAGYAIVLLPIGSPLMSWLYRGRYDGYLIVVAILLADALLAAAARPATLHLKVAGATKQIFLAYLLAAFVGLTALALLAPVYGVAGAAAAAPFSSLALFASLTVARRSSRFPATASVTAVAASHRP